MHHFRTALALCALFFTPMIASAHEVYLLSEDAAARALAETPFSHWQVITSNLSLFLFWAFVSAVIVFVVFFGSISAALEKKIDPLLAKLPPYAPVITRITIGLALLSAAYHGALFGPELPLAELFGGSAFFVSLILTAAGLMLLVGFYARLAALAMLGVFMAAVAERGVYLLTYASYLGEIALLLVLGAHKLGVHHKEQELREAPAWFLKAKRALAPYGFLLLRVSFGISLLYASLYAKILHNNLALEVTREYPGLVAFFGFEPHFLVLGAAIVELVIAVFFIIGFEIRFTSLYLLFWLTLSLCYFGEAVWPHLMLIGIPVAFIFYGYDRTSLEGRFFKRGRREPVL